MRILVALVAVAAFALVPVSAQQLELDGGRPQEQEDGVLRLGTEVVLVNFVVVHGGDFVDGLTADDFEVAEDGVPQKIEYFGAESTPFAATILLDKSESMEPRLRYARVAAARFMERASVKDRVALYLFGTDVRRVQDFVPGGRDLSDEVWDSSAEGVTKMYDCVVDASESLSGRPEFRRAILLLSDGADYGSSSSYDAAVKRALAAGATIYSVDVTPFNTSPVRDAEDLRARGVLKGLADRSGGRFFVSRNGNDLNEAFEKIIDEIGHQYTLSYSPTNTKRDGTWRQISVKPKRRGVDVRSRAGYTAPSS
jgi:Ca-activated chloride channel family protein